MYFNLPCVNLIRCPRAFPRMLTSADLTGRLENVEMRRTDAQYAKSLISFWNSYSLSMLTSSNISIKEEKGGDDLLAAKQKKTILVGM